MNKIFYAVALSAASTVAFAQYADIEGDYETGGASLQIIAMDDQVGVMVASASVVAPPCSGGVTGIGTITGDTLRFTPYKKTEGAEACSVTVKFSKNHKKASIDGDGCSAYFGASCGFEGQIVVKRR
jgi:hypothetical protein